MKEIYYSDHMAYMFNLGIQHELIKQVVQGDYEEIMDIINTEIEYPCLWIETPDMRVQGDNDYKYPSFIGNAVVLWKSDPHNKESVRYGKEMSYRVALSIYRKIHKEDDYINSMRGVEIMSLPPLTVDYLVGWRIQYTKHWKDHPICVDFEDMYIDTEDEISFSASRLFDESVNITASVINPPAGFSYVWKYQIDDGALINGGQGGSINLNESGTNIYLELTATKGSTIRYASIYIGPYVIVQQSIPYLFHPVNDR